jgi:hypothetical protein
MFWRTSRSASRWLSCRYRPISRAWFPNTLASSTPDTDRVSSVIALIDASASCVERDTRRRRWPTARVSQKKAGTVNTDTMVSCQLMITMATIDDTNVTTLARMVEAVVVTTDCTPPTSLASRDWISPVLVLVKKASDSVSRWEYSRSRRSRMTCCPTRVVW